MCLRANLWKVNGRAEDYPEIGMYRVILAEKFQYYKPGPLGSQAASLLKLGSMDGNIAQNIERVEATINLLSAWYFKGDS